MPHWRARPMPDDYRADFKIITGFVVGSGALVMMIAFVYMIT